MAAVNMPNVEGLNTVAELKNAIAKMTKELSWLLENIDWRNINQLHITLNGGASVTIENDGITVNDGTMDTFKVNTEGKVTMTGATVQSKNGYPKVVMDPDNQLFGAYASPTQSVTIGPFRTGSTDSPYVLFEAQGIGHYLTALNGVLTFFGFMELAFSAGAGRNISFRGEKLMLYLEQAMEIQSWEKIKNTTTGQTLDQAFSKKGDSTASAGYHNHGILPGTKLMVEGGGYVVWSASGDHTHVQQ